MEAFRSTGLKSVVYGGMIVAVLVVFVVQFRPGANSGRSGVKNECAAEVRGECISARDFRSTLALIAPRADEENMKQLQLRKRVMDGLVERTLLTQDAARLGVSVSDDDLNAELTSGRAYVSISADTPPYLVSMQLRMPPEKPMRTFDVKNANGQFDEKVYTKALKSYVGRGPAEFREMQRSEVIASRMRELIKSRVRVSDDELFDFFSKQTSKASFKYVRVMRDFFAPLLTPTKEALDNFAAAHKEEIDKAVASRKTQLAGAAKDAPATCKKARTIFVKTAVAASDDEKVAARKKIDDALAKITKGGKDASFGDVAAKITEDDAKGEVACYLPGKLPKPIDEAVANLKEGETSAVLEADTGFYVVKVEQALTGDAAEAAIRDEVVRQRWLAQESETKAAELAKALREAVAGGKSIDDATKEAVAGLGPKVKADDPDAPHVEESSDVTAQQASIRGAQIGVDVGSTVFALAKPGDVANDLVKLERGYAIVQLTEKKPATKEEFEKARADLAASVLGAKQQDALVGYVARLREAAKAEIKVNTAYVNEPKGGPADDGEE